MAGSSFIAIPPNITDPIVLRRILDKIVESIDIAYSNRGDSGFASLSEFGEINNYIKVITEEILANTKIYSKVDGTNPYIAPIAYDKEYTLGGFDLASIFWIENNPNIIMADGSNPFTAPIAYEAEYPLTGLDLVSAKWVIDNPAFDKQTAPTLISSTSANTEIKANADKIDELINILKTVGILT